MTSMSKQPIVKYIHLLSQQPDDLLFSFTYVHADQSKNNLQIFANIYSSLPIALQKEKCKAVRCE